MEAREWDDDEEEGSPLLASPEKEQARTTPWAAGRSPGSTRRAAAQPQPQFQPRRTVKSEKTMKNKRKRTNSMGRHRDPMQIMHMPERAKALCEILAPFFVEFWGTFFLVTSIGLNSLNGNPQAALGIGFTLVVIVFAGGHLSGAHYNPAVTLAVWLSRRNKIRTLDMLIYMIVQLLGSFLAGFFYWLIAKDTFQIGPGPGVDDGRAVFLEMMWTYLLTTVVLQTATTAPQAGNSFFGSAIGFTVVAGIITAGPISGGVFNPAVATGASLVHAIHKNDGAALEHLWIYWVGPMLGGLLSGVSFWFTNRREYNIDEDSEYHLFSSDVKSVADVSANQREGGKIIKTFIGLRQRPAEFPLDFTVPETSVNHGDGEGEV